MNKVFYFQEKNAGNFQCPFLEYKVKTHYQDGLENKKEEPKSLVEYWLHLVRGTEEELSTKGNTNKHAHAHIYTLLSLLLINPIVFFHLLMDNLKQKV